MTGVGCSPTSLGQCSFQFRTPLDRNTTTALVIRFVRQSLGQLQARVVMARDSPPAPRAKAVPKFVDSDTALSVHLGRPYAPELKPVERVGSYLKPNPLAKASVIELTTPSRRSVRSVWRRARLLRSSLNHCPLPNGATGRIGNWPLGHQQLPTLVSVGSLSQGNLLWKAAL